MNEGTYGLHLTMRIANISHRDALNDLAVVNNFLATLVQRIGMRILAGPLTGREDGALERQGCSGVVILYESHAAIHTYPFLGEAFLDIFSCKEFDVDSVHAIMTEFFGDSQVIERALVDRGIHWSANVNHEMASWLTTR